MKQILKLIACAVLSLIGSVAFAQNAGTPTPPSLTPSDVVQNQTKLLNKQLVVEGTLQNAGTNYFTNSRLVLKQSDSTDVLVVKLRVPLEIPRPANDTQNSPATASDYLGKKVRIKGVLKEENVRGLGRVIVLESTAPTVIE
jgi:hypothetical protein